MCDCGLDVGDAVDWIYIKSDGKPFSRQSRFWHGEIVDLWNTNLLGHWFVVRWESSNRSEPYSGPDSGIDPSFIPHAPHYFQSICSELRACTEGSLHPTSNKLKPRK